MDLPVYEKDMAFCMKNALKITYSTQVEEKVLEFARLCVAAKKKESQHMVDNNNEIKRFSTGTLGEIVLEYLFRMPIVDWTIADSKQYNRPDIPGFCVGVKTVELGKYPVIPKRNDYPQIICLLDRQARKIYVCGLATVEILNGYQDDNLILDKKLRARGTKTGFYGFSHLIPVKRIEDILSYKDT